MKHKFLLIFILVMEGCSTLPVAVPAPILTEKFGDAVRLARAQQTLNPNASKNNDPVLGIEGRNGKSIYERYLESFKTPPPTFEILNIPSVGSSR
jgi:hypothetical protein